MKLRTALALLASTLVAGSASATLSTFNFDGDYSSTGPATLSLFKGNAYGTFGTDTINGMSTGVYNFPAATSTQGLVVTHNAAPNGGGSYVNEYTIGYDIKFKGANPWASFFQTNTSNSNDGDLFRNGAGGIGISGVYDGTMLPDTWTRVFFTFDLSGEIGSAKTLYKYINGSLVGKQTLADGTDGRWSLDPTCLLLADNDGDTDIGSISSFSFEDRALTADEIAKYGSTTAGGLTPVPEPASLALLAVGVLPMIRRRKAA